jgi:hypothetical protein
MAFGITREELLKWKEAVQNGELAFLTHYWYDPRFPGVRTVTKVGCADLFRLEAWCRSNGLNPAYIHHRERFPHYDVIGAKQKDILLQARRIDQIERFQL